MYDTHTPAEWGQALAFGSLPWLACSFLVVKLAPADFKGAAVDAALTAAALLALLTITPGETR
jgi:hypothetical protein